MVYVISKNHKLTYAQIEIFSEILRQAKEQNPGLKPASVVLHEYIRDNHIQVPWEDITLPGGETVPLHSKGVFMFTFLLGRSLNSYRFAYSEFHLRGPDVAYPINPMKRQLAMDVNTPIGRFIAPKPMPGLSAVSRAPGLGQSLTPMSPIGGIQTTTQLAKKRGRPSKKEQEARRLHQSDAASLARVSQVAGSSGTLAGLSSATQSPVSSALARQWNDIQTPQGHAQLMGDTNSGSSGKKRRGRPPKYQNSNIVPPAHNAQRNPIDTPQSNRHQRKSGSPYRSGLEVGESNVSGSRSASGVIDEASDESRQHPHWKDQLLNNEYQTRS